MYVTTRPIRLSGINVPRGYKVPDEIKVPSHLLQAGWIVELPDEIKELSKSDIEKVAVSKEGPAEDPEPDFRQEAETEAPAEESGKADSDDIADYHVGGGWYRIDGENYRRDDAEKRLREE